MMARSTSYLACERYFLFLFCLKKEFYGFLPNFTSKIAEVGKGNSSAKDSFGTWVGKKVGTSWLSRD